MTTWKWRGQPKTTTKKLTLPSQYHLKFYYEYDPETGVFSKNGKEVGTDCNGYLVIKVNNTRHYVHRLIWVYMTGEEPDEIDHINRIKNDNRWSNLRNVQHTINVKNSTPQKRGSGVSGIYYREDTEKWRVYIRYNKKLYHMGQYQHPLDAIQARIEAEEIFWGKSHVHTNLK